VAIFEMVKMAIANSHILYLIFEDFLLRNKRIIAKKIAIKAACHKECKKVQDKA
jgi:hypothetical protein